MSAVLTGNPTLDLGHAKYWIEFLHGDSQGMIHISSSDNWQGKFFPIDDIPAALQYVQILHNRNPQGIYLRACTVGTVPRGGGRGAEEDSLTFPGFWADIDIAGPGHKTTNNLPPDINAVWDILRESGLPQPSVWIESGGGYYPWWLLRQPVTLDDQHRELIKQTAAHIDECLASAATRLGYHFGTGINDLARVLRLPGTVNRKVADQPTMCQAGSQDGPMYDLDHLTEAVQAAADQIVRTAPEAPQVREQRTFTGEGLSPFDAYESVDWADILGPAGWQLCYQRGGTRYWVRPGKARRDGHSATTGRSNDRDRLYVFTTETPFRTGESYTKGAAYAVLNHGGNMSAAARDLKRLGYGSSNGHHTTAPDALRTDFTVEDPAPPRDSYELNDTGNAKRLVDAAGGRHRYLDVERNWYRYNGRNWEVDRHRSVHQKMELVTAALHSEADSWAVEDPKKSEKIRKFAVGSGNASRVNAAVEMLRSQPGISLPTGVFDQHTHLINMANGTYDLQHDTFRDHHQEDMITKQFNTVYDPQATCPRWERFLEEAFPDVATRRYLQKALGYTLLGEADQRVIFLLYGPSGTGKSQLMRAMQLLFGDYGASAAASTFRARRGDGVPNDVHELRGKRMVSTSETSADALMDEELVKRITGNDIITSRGLYQDFQSWRPQCVIWMATNHLPQLNSDDDAIWKRVKPIPMNTVFAGRDDEVGAFAERVLMEEAAGIFNWLLAGVRLYRAEGFKDEPELLLRTVAAYQLESDTVAQFLLDSQDEELLVTDPDTSVASSVLYKMYTDWCSTAGSKALGIRRFKFRMERLGFESFRSDGSKWRGLRRGQMPAPGGGSWVVGTLT